MNPFTTSITIGAALGSGLMAGLYFIFSICVMRALGRLPAAEGISAMQQINIVIQNPMFFLVFFGTALLSLGLGSQSLFHLSQSGMTWLLAGSALYLIGNILVTIFFNVPLNNALDAATPASASGADLWQKYQSVWTGWNHVRTVTCLAATACFIQAVR